MTKNRFLNYPVMFQDSKCRGCPALKLRTPEQIKKIMYWHELFLSELKKIDEIKLILLGESFPANRYFYDLESNYEYGGLMYNLKKEFGVATNIDMIKLFRELGVIIYDCAYCPLHRLKNIPKQKKAATHCLKSYKLNFLDEHDVPIITFFPSGKGFLKRELPELSAKIHSEYTFNSLAGLKNEILNLLKSRL